MSLTNFVPLLAEKKILVVGDVILDKYIKGVVNRISPEAPIQIVEVDQETTVLGGAGNVANNICSLGGMAYIAGLIGKDENGALCKSLLERVKINTTEIVTDSSRPTTTKVRVIADRQQIVRFDYEKTYSITTEEENELIAKINKVAPSMDAIVVSDYAKGVVSMSVMRTLTKIAEKYKVPLFVDPRPQHAHLYGIGVTAFTPNLKEAYGLRGIKEGEVSLEVVADNLVRQYDANILITQGANGMTLFSKDGSSHHVPAYAKEVYDIVGAGDTVIATLALAAAAGASIEQAAEIANCAAAVVVTKIGTATVTPEELIENILYVESHISR